VFLGVGVGGAAAGDKVQGVLQSYRKKIFDIYDDFANGTSVAAPVVTGIAAMLRSYFPKVRAAQLKRILIETAHHVHGLKLVDAAAAVKRLMP